jgi:hypothetical protein
MQMIKHFSTKSKKINKDTKRNTLTQPGTVNTLPPKGTTKYGVDVEGMTKYILQADLVLVPKAAIKELGKRNRVTVRETCF